LTGGKVTGGGNGVGGGGGNIPGGAAALGTPAGGGMFCIDGIGGGAGGTSMFGGTGCGNAGVLPAESPVGTGTGMLVRVIDSGNRVPAVFAVVTAGPGCAAAL